jgi:pimeloyl-ACP methyl ester carboxylesterase
MVEPSTDAPVAPESEHTVRTAGRRLAYAEYGPSDGTPVLFLHGTPGSRLLASLFAERGVRLLAPDRPGSGRSAPWPERSIADTASALSAVLDDAGAERASVVAFSGGAPFALALAATQAERVERVDVVGGAVPPDVADAPALQSLLGTLARRAPWLLRGAFRGQAWLAGRLDPSVVVDQYTASDADPVPDRVGRVVCRDFREAFAGSRRGAVTDLRLVAQDWGVALSAVETRVTLWHGEADTNVPVAGARRLADRLPNARLRALAGADHLRSLLRAVPEALDRLEA